jgi:hypothetical protein
MTIDAALPGTVVRDAELRRSAAGKPWMSVIVRSGDGDVASSCRWRSLAMPPLRSAGSSGTRSCAPRARSASTSGLSPHGFRAGPAVTAAESGQGLPLRLRRKHDWCAFDSCRLIDGARGGSSCENLPEAGRATG